MFVEARDYVAGLLNAYEGDSLLLWLNCPGYLHDAGEDAYGDYADPANAFLRPHFSPKWRKRLSPAVHVVHLPLDQLDAYDVDRRGSAGGLLPADALANATGTARPRLVFRAMYEADRTPLRWVARLNQADEIWVPTEWNRAAFERSGVAPHKLVVLPETFDAELFNLRRRPALRLLLGSPLETFTLFSVFKFEERKGWDLLLRAFFAAFDASEPVQLYLKISECEKIPSWRPDAGADVSDLLRALADLGYRLPRPIPALPRVRVDCAPANRSRMAGLFASADVYVSTSRGEGWGLPLVQSMALGIPCIATNWSGHTEYLTDANAWLLPVAQLTRSGQLGGFGRTAEVDPAAAARVMREAFASPARVKEKGFLAARDVARFAPPPVVAAMAARLLQLGGAAAAAPRGRRPRGSSGGRLDHDPDPDRDRDRSKDIDPIAFSHTGADNGTGTGTFPAPLAPQLPATVAAFVVEESSRAAALASFRALLALQPPPLDLPGGKTGAAAAGGGGGGPPRLLASAELLLLNRSQSRSAAAAGPAAGGPLPAAERAALLAACTPVAAACAVSEVEDPLGAFRARLENLSADGVALVLLLSADRHALLACPLEALAQPLIARRAAALGAVSLRPAPVSAGVFANAAPHAPRGAVAVAGFELQAGPAGRPLITPALDGLMSLRPGMLLPTAGLAGGGLFSAAAARAATAARSRWPRSPPPASVDELLMDLALDLQEAGEPILAHSDFVLQDLREAADPDAGRARASIDCEAAASAAAAPRLSRAWARGRRGSLLQALAGRLAPELAGLRLLYSAPFSTHTGYASEAISLAVALEGRVLMRTEDHDPAYGDSTGLPNFATLPHVRAALLRLQGGAPGRASEPSEAGAAGGAALEVTLLHAIGSKFHCRRSSGGSGSGPAGGRARRRQYCIGRTMFETSSLPPSWVRKCNKMDEIWVPSQFNVETFARAGVAREKLFVLHQGVPRGHLAYRPARVAFRHCRPDDVIFLSHFEWSDRKGGDLLLRAFMAEFTSGDHACLVVKTHLQSASAMGKDGSASASSANATIASIVRAALAAAKAANPDLPRSQFLFRPMSEERILSLYASSDAFVLPSRGEGWCRPCMEAMAMGLPVIATNWSGMTEFIDEQVGYPLPYTLEVVASADLVNADYLHHRWAAPDEASLRAVLRAVARDSEGRRRKGRAAKARVEAKFTAERVADQLIGHLRRVAKQSNIYN